MKTHLDWLRQGGTGKGSRQLRVVEIKHSQGVSNANGNRTI
jgi:hypothetical protein